MKQLTCSLLSAFRPAFVSPDSQPPPSKEDALHTAAISKLTQDSCTLQYHALKFVASILLTEPGTLKHLRTEGLWELAYGQLFFFWGGAADSQHQLQGTQLNPCSVLHGVDLKATYVHETVKAIVGK